MNYSLADFIIFCLVFVAFMYGVGMVVWMICKTAKNARHHDHH